MRRGIPVPCEVCGSEFVRNRAEQRTCGRKCGEALRRTVTGTLPPAPVRDGWHSHRTTDWASCRIYPRDCAWCGTPFVARKSHTKCCSRECSRLSNIRRISDAISRRYREDPEFRARWITRGQNRRASKLGAGSITSPADLITYLMARDRGRCRVEDCLFADRRVRAKAGPGRPSIDHIVPLSLGGEHSLENIQLAHYRCNLSKHNRIRAVQPLLVG